MLISLKLNERLWAICSDRSRQISDCEQISQVAQDKMNNRERIAHVAHDKWARVSDSLKSLMINEQMSDSLKKIGLKKSKNLVF